MSLEILIPLVGLLCFAFGFAAGRGSAPVAKQNKALPPVSPIRCDDPDLLQRVERLLREGNKIEALKAYREGTGIGLKSAKDFVDEFQRNLGPTAALQRSIAPVPTDATPETMQKVDRLLREGKKIEALKAYRDATGLGLKEAKDFVDQLDRQLRS